MGHEEEFNKGFRDRIQKNDSPNILDDIKMRAAAGYTSEEALRLCSELGDFALYILKTPHEEFDEDYAKDKFNELLDKRTNLQNKKEIVALAEAILIQLPIEISSTFVTNLLVKLLGL